MTTYPQFKPHDLGEGQLFHVGRLPEELLPDTGAFELLWDLHPSEYYVIQMHGRPVQTPRWQQAYGSDYHYTGRTNLALAIPAIVEPLHAWARCAVDPRLNGLLLNWYDGQLSHYIGPHHDSTKSMVRGAPIVTVSLGEERIFRLTHPRRKIKRDFLARNGTVFVMPFDTNLVWKHAVPEHARYRGRRISITLRAFEMASIQGIDGSIQC
jgi:alkylated DNA repair dioxygenase AlkB